MAKEKKDAAVQNGVKSMAAASEELSRELIVLYKSKSFTRAGKELADLLFRTGIEAGALLSGVSELTDRGEKIRTANHALLKLNQTMYIANVMQMAEYYRLSQVAPLIDYCKLIIDGLRELLSNVPETVRKIHFRAPVVVEDPEIAAAAAAAAFARASSETGAAAGLPQKGAEEDKTVQSVQLSQPAEEEEDDGFDDPV